MARIISAMLLYKSEYNRKIVLELINDRLYGDLKKPQIDISKLPKFLRNIYVLFIITFESKT